MIKSDIHTHSIASGHATRSTIADMAKQASHIGIELLGISDHGPATMGSAKASYFRSLSFAPKIRCSVELLYGVELNILDYNGTVDLDNEILSHLDFSIASMHTQNLKPGSRDEHTQAYIQAIKNPYINLIGHCDDVKYPVDYLALVQAAKEYHVLFEINNASLSPSGYRGDTIANNKIMLHFCKLYKQPIILSSDSHGVANIGDVLHANTLAESVDFPKELILNNQLTALKSYLI
ncbi:MAG: phosphatase [Lachnospiraceae bacterium]|nr:phosphatase [Lachnospiraceae bacterium]